MKKLGIKICIGYILASLTLLIPYVIQDINESAKYDKWVSQAKELKPGLTEAELYSHLLDLGFSRVHTFISSSTGNKVIIIYSPFKVGIIGFFISEYSGIWFLQAILDKDGTISRIWLSKG